MTEASTIIHGRRVYYDADPDNRIEVDSADQIPHFETEAEEQAWWETHALSETFWRTAKPVPEDQLPPVREQPSRFALRLSSTLHRALIRAAKAEGQSLNTYIVEQLAWAVGAREAREQAPRSGRKTRAWAEQAMYSAKLEDVTVTFTAPLTAIGYWHSLREGIRPEHLYRLTELSPEEVRKLPEDAKIIVAPGGPMQPPDEERVKQN
jgi:predicted HicB family RNase H-like nuclease